MAATAREPGGVTPEGRIVRTVDPQNEEYDFGRLAAGSEWAGGAAALARPGGTARDAGARGGGDAGVRGQPAHVPAAGAGRRALAGRRSEHGALGRRLSLDAV